MTSSVEPGTQVELRPRYEGANIGPWIGFKHVNYLVEEALIAHFRRLGNDVRSLYADHGLCWEIVDIDTRIIHVFNLDEAVRLIVRSRAANDGELTYEVVIVGDRDGDEIKLARSRVSVVLREDSRWASPRAAAAPELASAVVPEIRRSAPASGFGSPPASGLPTDVAGLTQGRNGFAWTFRIPYFYCHFTERLQMSGYLRIMEDAVDRFLADRGVSIRMLLDDQQLIPVVPRSRITMLDEAYMEEDLHVVLVVDDVFKNLTFTVGMECYVQRGQTLVNVAAGAITHGYARLEDRASWGLSDLDERLCRALAR
ncbi:thioesterase family protein [Nocardia sp. NPDC005998]|uniref:thioesterase family protein n=1 Tax=Nocardia sp. NPDC005998 TaxID=3156894 RepID=UPI0033AD7B70